jgi:hypothetical protein
LPHAFCQERLDTFRFDVFRFDAFRFTTGLSLDSYEHSKAFSDAYLHRIFCCHSIDTWNVSIVCCKLFDLERFGAFRYGSVLFAALRPALSTQSSLSIFAPSTCSGSSCTSRHFTHLRRPEVGLLPSAACHSRRDSMLLCSGLSTFRVTIIAKS